MSLYLYLGYFRKPENILVFNTPCLRFFVNYKSPINWGDRYILGRFIIRLNCDTEPLILSQALRLNKLFEAKGSAAIDVNQGS